MMPTMANPSYTPPTSGGAGGQSSGSPAPGQTTINGGPGPVDGGGNSGIVSGNPTASSGGTMMSSMTGGPGSMTSGSGGGSNQPQPSASNTATTILDPNQNNGGTVRPSPPTSSTPPASTGAVCPYFDNSAYTDTRGATYTVDCNSTYTGNILARTNSTTTPSKQKRQNGGQAAGLTAAQCMVLCDTNPACIAINVDCAGTCTLLGSVASTIEGTCGVAARRISGGSNGGGNDGVQTITVCAARTGTTTVFTTATLTTCAASGMCPGGNGRVGMIG